MLALRTSCKMLAPTLATHTVVIGGGIIGSSSLYYLARHPGRPAGSTITLIEACNEVAPGASGKAGGFLALDWHGIETASLAELSFKLHRELADAGNGKERWGYRDVETLQVHLDTTKSRSKCPKELDWVDSKIVTSTSSMGGGGTTAQVTPKHLVQYLVEEACKQPGVSVRLGTRATSLETTFNGAVKALTVTDSVGKEESLPIDRLVVAAGPWTGKLLAPSLIPCQSPSLSDSRTAKIIRKAQSIDGSRAHSIIVRGTRPTSNHCLFTEMRYGPGGRKAGAPEVYARSDDTVYVCGGSDDVPLPLSADEVCYDPKKTKELIEQARVISPDVLGADAAVVAEQACYLPCGNGPPVVDGSPATGLYVAAGHTCWGITLGPGTGKVIAELIYDGEAKSADIQLLMV
ncbi:FAD dependent oxidoreductase [Tilletiaria anomala UBC 951]|uniref:FAD dependent oxidoreductase n=1 Tax=Tilletiaria anomala (strain ATCC 24038 / CBS 436.72 / UBC 951) TaxID=1037660 RepID=A0A066W3E7_TILAU|nr:FAD dependent oxidoreductase [Tilletiaria anomala UBC 951]KDN45290.1 FAD dependent oxidoreductase [Tilletiaria anomala UBC 951]